MDRTIDGMGARRNDFDSRSIPSFGREQHSDEKLGVVRGFC